MLDWAAEHDPERGLALAASLEGFWLVREPSEGASRLEPLLARTPDAEPELRAHALRASPVRSGLCGEYERAGPSTGRALQSFVASGNEVQTANLRYRVAGHMVTMGETAAAWPLLEESLRTFRRLGPPRGEAQVLGYLAEKPHERAISRARSSSRLRAPRSPTRWLGMVGERTALAGAADLERERGDLDAAEGHGRSRRLELSLALVDRRRVVLTAAKLAVIAMERGDAGTARRLWGAIESEQASSGPTVGDPPRGARSPGPSRGRTAFASARAEGCLLSIAEAAGLEVVPAG